MAVDKRYTQASWRIMEQLLEVGSLSDALSGSLEIIAQTLSTTKPNCSSASTWPPWPP